MTKKYGLCAGRHEIPGIDGFIFESIENPLDFAWMESHATEVLTNQAAGVHTVHVKVTGLTAALIATINAAHKLGMRVVAEHFDRDTGEYIPQAVL